MNKQKIMMLILFITLGFVFGYSTGMVYDALEDIGLTMISGGIGLFIFGIVSVYIHLILHEVGHLFAGLISGYEFSFFRVHKWTWAKVGQKIQLKTYPLAAAPGQCIMNPEPLSVDHFPYVFYNRGGYLMNFLLSAVAIVLFLWNPADGLGLVLFRYFLLLFAVIGIFLGLTNAIPLNMNGVENDGANIRSIGEDKSVAHAFYNTLRISHELQQGYGLAELPEDLVRVEDDADFSSSIVASFAVNYTLWLRAHGKLEKAERIETRLLERETPDIAMAAYEMEQRKRELLQESPELTKESQALIQYVQLSKDMPETLAYQYAYTLRVKRDDALAKNLEKKIKSMDKHLYEKEWKASVEYVNQVKNIHEEYKKAFGM